MDIRISEDDIALHDAVRRFAGKVLKPMAKEIDERSLYAGLHYPAASEMGLMGLNLPEKWGGPGVSPVALYLAIESMAEACGSTTSAITAHYMATDAIEIGTNEELKQKYLPSAAAGELIGAYAMTEPRGGSNPADMRVRAVRDGADYRISGTKHFISNGGNADFIVVFCVTDPDAEPKYRGISAIVVDADTTGFKPMKAEPTYGLRGGHIWEIHFDDCVVPASNLLGKEGTGFKNAMIGLDGSRLDVAAMCTGIAKAAIDEAIAWAKQRLVDGKPIGEFQGIRWMLADMQTEFEASRLLGLAGAAKRGRGERYTREATFAKLHASEMVYKVTDLAMQIHGGYGYSREMNIERYVRDARIARIFDGSSEIHRNIIGRMMLED